MQQPVRQREEVSPQARVQDIIPMMKQAHSRAQIQQEYSTPQPTAPVGIGVAGGKKQSLLENIEKMERQRQERRRLMEEQKANKRERQIQNEAQGKNIDAEFDIMIERERLYPES